ncbi:MAG: hypothetical protein U5K54_16370 [Cytophagales bacterium]|nr:hypothetical protein [Cytophagales bacterium]
MADQDRDQVLVPALVVGVQVAGVVEAVFLAVAEVFGGGGSSGVGGKVLSN